MVHEQLGQSGDAAARSQGIERRLAPLRAITAALRRKPVVSGLVGGGLVLLVIVSARIGSLIRGSSSTVRSVSASAALDKLTHGDLAAAKEIAIQLHVRNAASYDDISLATFVLGVATAREANVERDLGKRRKLFLMASRYLDEAYHLGFPDEQRGEGLYLLGLSLYRAGDYARSIPRLLEALDANPAEPTELHGLLAGAYADDSVGGFDKALEHVRRLVTDESLPPIRRDEARILESRILFKMGNVAASREALKHVPADSPLRAQAKLIQAQLLMDEADRLRSDVPDQGGLDKREAAMRLYGQVINTLHSARQQDSADSNASSVATYLLGVVYQKTGDFVTADQTFLETWRQNYDSPVGLAAGLGKADVQRQLGNHEIAIESYLRVLNEAGRTEIFSNPWISLGELRSYVHAAYQSYWDVGMFEQAIKLAEAAVIWFSPEESWLWQAEAHHTWAQRLLEESAAAPLSEAQAVLDQARRQFRMAGRLFEQLAQLRIATREYPDDLWKSADSFLKGHDFQSAVRMINSYMKHGPRNRIPHARVALGQAHLSLNNLDKGLQPLLACITQTPNDPDSYDARLVAAHVYLEQDDLLRAKKMLIDNLENGDLTPDSIAWRNSLFALGKVLHREGAMQEAQSRKVGVDDLPTVKTALKNLEQSYHTYQQSIQKLTEFIQRYQNSSSPDTQQKLQIVEARYLMADAHRQSGKWPRKRLTTVTIETTRAALTRQMQTELRLAATIYQELETELRRLQDEAELTGFEQRILRNCYFARADTLFDMGRYEEAIKAYSSATNRYHDQPEALEAFVQIASCYRRLDRLVEARGTLQQARVVLSRIDPKVDFTTTTLYDRERWNQLLDWLSTL